MISITLLVILTIIVLSGLFIVEQQDVAIIERFGKFQRVADAGLRWRVPLVDRIVHYAGLRIEEKKIEVQTITKDSVPVQVDVSLQFKVVKDKVKESYYQLDDPEEQMSSYVFNVVRSKVPKLSLDELFSRQDDIQEQVKETLATVMDDYGYEIIAAPITDIDPVESVKLAMAKINEQDRLALAAKKEAERKVTLAEAEGMGIAAQRKAIVTGFKDSIADFSQGVPGIDPKEVMQMVLVAQYFDALKEISHGTATTVFVPHSPGVVGNIMNQLRTTIMSGDTPVGDL